MKYDTLYEYTKIYEYFTILVNAITNQSSIDDFEKALENYINESKLLAAKVAQLLYTLPYFSNSLNKKNTLIIDDSNQKIVKFSNANALLAVAIKNIYNNRDSFTKIPFNLKIVSNLNKLAALALSNKIIEIVDKKKALVDTNNLKINICQYAAYVASLDSDPNSNLSILSSGCLAIGTATLEFAHIIIEKVLSLEVQDK